MYTAKSYRLHFLNLSSVEEVFLRVLLRNYFFVIFLPILPTCQSCVKEKVVAIFEFYARQNSKTISVVKLDYSIHLMCFIFRENLAWKCHKSKIVLFVLNEESNHYKINGINGKTAFPAWICFIDLLVQYTHPVRAHIQFNNYLKRGHSIDNTDFIHNTDFSLWKDSVIDFYWFK